MSEFINEYKLKRSNPGDLVSNLEIYAAQLLKLMHQDKIEGFKGPTRWLSNFAPVRVRLDGQEFDSVEHAYQAAKAADPLKRTYFLMCSASEAKQ